MPNLRNNHTGDLILPDGTALRVRGPVVTLAGDAWERMKTHPVVAAWADKRWIVEVAEAAPKPAPEPDAEPAPVAPAEPLVAVHKGGGKWVIKRGTVTVSDKGMTKDEAQAFNALSDADKQAFIEG